MLADFGVWFIQLLKESNVHPSCIAMSWDLRYYGTFFGLEIDCVVFLSGFFLAGQLICEFFVDVVDLRVKIPLEEGSGFKLFDVSFQLSVVTFIMGLAKLAFLMAVELILQGTFGVPANHRGLIVAFAFPKPYLNVVVGFLIRPQLLIHFWRIHWRTTKQVLILYDKK